MIGSLYVQQLDANKPIAVDLKTDQRLPNLKPNSYLNIDWLHDLLYWVKDKKQILVSHVTQAHRPTVLANKLFDYITCLAVNPIDSLVFWVEFDGEFNEYILYKSFLDGSERDSIFTFQIHIKRMQFDFQSKRLYYLSSFELSSITYYGTDRQVVSESHSIFQFEVIDQIVYWIEYNSNQLFRSDANDFKNQTVLNFNQTINRFKIVDQLRQPKGINRCFKSNCSDLCLPVDHEYFKCVCHQQNVCNDNQELQLIFNHQYLVRPSTTQTPTTTTMISTSKLTIPPKESQNNNNETTDKIIFDPIEQIDSISFNERNTESTPEPTRHVFFSISGKADNGTLLFKTEMISNGTKINITEDVKLGRNVHFELDEKFFASETKESVQVKPSSDKPIRNVTSIVTNATETTTTNKISKLSTILSITSTELTLREKNFTETVPIEYEVKEYDYQYIPKYLHRPLMYGFSILLIGLFIGTMLSSLAIKVYGRHKWYVSEPQILRPLISGWD